ncbi:NAD(P)/FAD-dependent oxidoreductase [Nonomuraea coxensis]|nr:FAD-dependent oxidoreductase [Nonomuraea coxensis]
MRRVDVLVVGAGLAGLHTARLLARRGLDVLVIDRRRPPGPGTRTTGIRTTGIFVRRTLDDFDLPEHLLGPGIRDVLLYPPSRRSPVRLTSDRDEYRVADMPGVYRHARHAAQAAGAEVLLGVRYVGARAGVVTLEGAEPVAARFVVGADGARSHVARDLGLDVNRRFLVGAELVHPIAPGTSGPAFHCGLDPCLRLSELAAAVVAGYLRTGDEDVLRRYDGGALRARFRGRLLLRRAFAGVRSPVAAEAAVGLLRGRAGRALAARVLFGDGSFPDVRAGLADLAATR